MKLLTIDSLRDFIPPLTEEEYQQLCENIIRDGCREPIVIWRPDNGCAPDEAVIIDGHNRHKICIEHGIPFEVKDLRFEDENSAKVWIIKNQLGRRNLNESQRAMLGVPLEKIYARQAKDRQAEQARRNQPQAQKVADLPPIEKKKSREEAARDMKVSPRTIQLAKKVEEACIPSVAAMVKKGDLAVSAAETISILSVQEQGVLARKGPDAIVKKASEMRAEKKAHHHAEPMVAAAAEEALWNLGPENDAAKRRMPKNQIMQTEELHKFIEKLYSAN